MGCGWNVQRDVGVSASPATGPLTRAGNGCRLACRVTPKTSRNAIDGIHTGADGRLSLKARVTAAPEEGKANKALIKLLGKETGLARSTMSVISGGQSRNKILLIEGEPSQLEETLTAWLGTYHE